MLGHRAEDIVGRSIKVIQGPKTDSVGLVGAVKNAGLLAHTKLKTVLYSSSGKEFEVVLSFSPQLEDDGSLSGCLAKVIPADCEVLAALNTKWGGGVESARRAALEKERRQYRAMRNFHTGLMLQQSAQQAKGGAAVLPPWL
jgi:hypothetical protein